MALGHVEPWLWTRTPSKASPEIHWISRRLLDVAAAGEGGVCSGETYGGEAQVGSTGSFPGRGLIFATVGPRPRFRSQRRKLRGEGEGSLVPVSHQVAPPKLTPITDDALRALGPVIHRLSSDYLQMLHGFVPARTSPTCM